MKKLFFNIIIGLFVFTSCGLFNKVTKTKTTDIVHVEATKVVEDHTEASSTL
jgi:hypothetical protein